MKIIVPAFFSGANLALMASHISDDCAAWAAYSAIVGVVCLWAAVSEYKKIRPTQ